MGRLQVQSLEHLRRLASGATEPVEVVHLIGVARFTKWVVWCEDEKRWYVDEDESMGRYNDKGLACWTALPVAIERGTLYVEQDDGGQE